MHDLLSSNVTLIRLDACESVFNVWIVVVVACGVSVGWERAKLSHISCCVISNSD